MRRFLQVGYLLPLAVSLVGFVTAVGGIVGEAWLRWTAAGLSLLIGIGGVAAKVWSDERAERQRDARRGLALRAALEQQLVVAVWLPDYIPPGVRLAHVEQRVRLGVDIRRGLEAEASGSGGDFEVGLEGLYATPRTEQVSLDGDRRAAVTATLEDVAAEHPQVVLLGDPGSGKSWLLRNYAGLLIRQQLDRLSIDHPRIPDGLEVPILVRADEFARLLDEANGDVWAALSAVVAAACSGGVSTDTRQELQRWLRDAMVSATQAPPVATTVLIDAFDERPALRHDQPDRLRDALNLLAKSPHVRLVLCSRMVGYHSPFDQGIAYETAHVLPFGLPQIEQFIDAWYQDTPGSAAELTALVRGTPLRTLAAVPLLLSFLCLLGPQRALGRRAVLYDSVLERLLDRPWERRTPHLWNREATASRRVLLGVVADAMSRDRWRDRITLRELLEVVGGHCRAHTTWSTSERSASAELQQLGSVLVPSGPEHDSWMWVHRTLHEFCLADHLVRQEANGGRSAVHELRPHLWYDHDWHETISLEHVPLCVEVR